MNEQYFEKLRNIYSSLAETEMDKQKIEEMIYLYDLIMNFCKIGRSEGILEMEAVAESLTGSGCKAFLRQMILQVVNGTEPERLEEIGLVTIFSGGYEAFESLQCLMCLRGVLLIQEGQSPYCLETVLKAYFNKKVLTEYEERKLRERENRKAVVRSRIDDLKKSCDESYFDIPFRIRLSEMIMTLDDNKVQDCYYIINRTEWARAFRALSGEAAERILMNISVDEADYLMEEVEHYSVRMPFAEEECEHIFKSIN
ncbi:MAG: FliG C-terminal domain-containing protein [Lachnospiraceae bacterium]